MIKRFKDFFKTLNSNVQERNRKKLESEKKFYLVDLYKYLDKNIDDVYDRVVVRFDKFDKNVEVDLYKGDKVSNTIRLILRRDIVNNYLTPFFICDRVISLGGYRQDREIVVMIEDFLDKNNRIELEEEEE